MFIRINNSKKPPLVDLYHSGNIEEFRQIISQGENLNCLSTGGKSLIDEIIRNKDFNNDLNKLFFDAMIDAGVHLGCIGREQTPLRSSISYQRDIYYMKRILESGVDASCKDERINYYNDSYYFDSPLHDVMVVGDLEKIKLLLEYNADVNVINDSGESILFDVLRSHRSYLTELVDILINHGADPNIKCDHGKISLHILSININGQEQFNEILDVLLKNNVDINSACNNMYTSLVYAVIFKNHAAMNTLIDRGADINFKGKNGKTPAMIAVERGNYDEFKILCDAGCNLRFPDSEYTNMAHVILANSGNIFLNDFMWFFEKNSDLLFEKNKNSISAMSILKSKYPAEYKKINKYLEENKKEYN